MKFLGITAYAAALLTSVYALPGGGGHGNKHEWHHHKGKEHKEIHHKLYPFKATTTVEVVATEVETVVLTAKNPPSAQGTGISVISPVIDTLPAECPLTPNTLFGEELLHFTGIFYGDFHTGGTGQDILGPLAVGGNFHAPNYIVNANHDINCAADETSSFDSVGLVVGRDSTTSNTHLRGDNLIAGNGDASQYDQQLGGCRVIVDESTGHFDFPRSSSDAVALSRALASLNTNRVLDRNGVVSSLLDNDDVNFKVFHFKTCQAASCGVSDSDASTPDEIFFGIGNWNGPNGDVPSNTHTVVFNVPVTSGDTITLRTNAPTHGFHSCNTIYNFYPVDENGDFDPDGEITIHRETGSQLEGLVIAPRAHIRDGNTGNFAGTVVGLDYDWLDQSAGVEIHDWRAAGCSNYGGCLPDDGVTIVNPPEPSVTNVPEPSITGEGPPGTDTVTVVPSETNTNDECTGDKTIIITATETTTETTTETINQPNTANTDDSNIRTVGSIVVTTATVTEQLPGPTQTVYVIGEENKGDDGYHGGYDKKSKEKKHKKKGDKSYNKFDRSW